MAIRTLHVVHRTAKTKLISLTYVIPRPHSYCLPIRYIWSGRPIAANYATVSGYQIDKSYT